MNSQVLCLSPGYEPIGRCSWKRAVTLWFTGKINVEAEYDHEVHSVSFAMNVPAVIRFLKGPARAKSRIRMSRENIYLRDGAACQYCGRHVSRAQATYDHVIPRAQGGKSEWGNLVLACNSCNRHKAARTPEQSGMKLRTKPARPTHIAEVWTLTMEKDEMPPQWRQFLKDWAYWHTELEP